MTDSKLAIATKKWDLVALQFWIQCSLVVEKLGKGQIENEDENVITALYNSCVFMCWILYAALFSTGQAGYKRTEKNTEKGVEDAAKG